MRTRDVIDHRDQSVFERLKEFSIHGIPHHVDYRALRAVKVMSLLLTVIPLATVVITHVMDGYPAPPYRGLQAVTNLAFCAFSLGMFFVLRSRGLALPTLVNMGLVFQVGCAFFFNTWNHFEPYPPDFNPRLQFPASAFWVMMFPLAYPTTLNKVIVAGIASVLTAPIVFGIAALYHGEAPPSLMLFHICFTNFMFFAISVFMFKRTLIMQEELNKRRRMGSYILEEKLGEGGMGEVWRANHMMLRRPAAIKLVHRTALGSPRAREVNLTRFEREAQSTALLYSPHTIQLYDFGHMEDGTFFYVMELLEGMYLKDFLRVSGPLPQERAIFFLQQACDSLIEAHRHSLIHRDIKPGNMMICRYGERHDWLKILDFGMVKATTAPPVTDPGMSFLPEQPADKALTRQGEVHGTPLYMAPEMILGEIVDHRYDIYALGCVAYQMLMGHPPFSSRDQMGLFHKHVTAPPPPLIRSPRMPIDAALSDLVMAALAKRPEDRPHSAAEFARRLDAIPLENPWSETRADEWWEAHGPKSSPRPSPFQAAESSPQKARDHLAASKPQAEPDGDGRDLNQTTRWVSHALDDLTPND